MTRKHRMLTAVVSAAALLFLSSALVFAQSDTAQISGFVKDPTGAVVPKANLAVRNEATGLERRLTTNDAGYYVVTSLPPGYYTVSVEATGFKKFVKTQNKLDPNIAATVDAVLEVGTVTETVEVVASVTRVQSETATVGKLIESSQIQNMMLNGRNPIFLALLKPGVRGGSLAGFSFGLASGGFSINGSRNEHNLITFDGAVATRTRANDSSIGTADLETIQEIQILTANYNAEYGRMDGGQIRMVTKTGTRDFHGSGYEYFRNNELDANSWSRNRAAQPREARRYNQFGYIVSGPVYIPGKWNQERNKLFFLWSQEWVRFRQETTTIQTVPSSAMRRGDFSELLNPANPFFSRVRTVNDPDTRAPFPNNVIPPSRLSPNGLGFLRSYPEPSPGFLQGRNNFIQTRPQPTDQRKDTISIDFIPAEKHSFRFRHQMYNWTQEDAFRSGTDRAVTDWARPNKTVSLNYIWTVSPTLVNELLATTSIDRVYIGVQREGGRFERSRYGITYPYIFPERKEIFDKIPTIDIANFVLVDGGPYPAKSTGPVYVVSNNTTKILGNHTLKWGASFERSGENDFDQINVTGVPGGSNNQNGRFVFDDTRAGAATTGLAIGNGAMGLFTTYAEIGQRSFTPYRSHMFDWFAQDSWKASPKLRLEVGVRHTLMTPYFYSLWGNMVFFDPKRYDPGKAVVQDPKTGYILSGDRYNGVVIPGKGWPDAARGRIAIADSKEFDLLFTGGSRSWGEFHKLNFQPRIGVAYQITAKTVARVGFGRFLTKPFVAGSVFPGGNPPLQPMVSIATGQADNPAGGQPSAFPLFFMTLDPVFKIPTAYNWNATLEREVGFNTTVQVAYIGRVGLFMQRERNINQLQPGTLQNPANAGSNANVMRPYKGFAFIQLGENSGRSAYRGLQIEVTRRFTRGLSYGLAYTYSKSMDNGSNYRARIYNNFDGRSFWGPSDFDTRHIAVINFIYELPFFKNRTALAGKLLGGWQVTGITQFQTGTPFTVGTGEDFAGIGSGNEFQPWNKLGDPKLPRGERRFSQGAGDQNSYFRTKLPDGSLMFTTPQPGTFANETRNTLYNVGFQNWNMALFKDFVVGERHRVQFRAEFFNWPNHPNWGGVDGNPRSGTFGKVTGKSSERNVQISVRYNF